MIIQTKNTISIKLQEQVQYLTSPFVSATHTPPSLATDTPVGRSSPPTEWMNTPLASNTDDIRGFH